MAEDFELPEDSPWINGSYTVYDDETLSLERDVDLDYTPQIGDKLRATVEGDTLSNLAGEIYGNSALWHVIAKANPSIEDIFRLPSGIQIIIPNPDNYLQR
jgi:nucleoid-associated protein YgaU